MQGQWLEAVGFAQNRSSILLPNEASWQVMVETVANVIVRFGLGPESAYHMAMSILYP